MRGAAAEENTLIRPPVRHPMHQRRPAPRPDAWHLRGAAIGFWGRILARVNRWAHPTWPGRWWRRRLRRGLVISRVEIPLGRGSSGVHDLTIGFLSDLHAGTFMDERDLMQVFETLAAEAPDLVCLGGDLVNASSEEMLHYRRPLALLDPPLGIYAVPGNHEYAAERDLKTFRDVLHEANARVLVNEGVRVQRGGESLWLAGVDDHCLGEPDIALALHGASEHEPIVLLSHHPDFFHEAASVGVDLTLSGHTHGGQIVIGGRTPCRHTVLGYWRGHFHDMGAQLYVSRGVGVTMLPLRIGAPAELALLRLQTRR